jgi:hypothetical protein
MRRLVLFPLTLAAVFALAAPAPAASPTERRLVRDVKVLKAQVKALQKKARDTQNLALGSLVLTGCVTAVTADAFQGTWAVIDDVSNKTTQPKTWFGPQQAVNDFQTCQGFNITRAPTAVPPTVNVFNSLLVLFR